MAPPINRFIYLIILIGLSQSVIAQSKPNISSIKVDDQGYADWGFNESNVIQAPHIDNLVTESIQSLQSYMILPILRTTFFKS